MKALALWAARSPFLAIMFCLGIVAGGAWALSRLPIDAMPDVTNVQVQVVTRASALSATEVEAQITQPIERGMAGIPGLTLTRSISKLGISIVTLIFSDDVDGYFARAQVNERLRQLSIPPDVGQPELGPITTALGEIYMIELKGEGRSLEELRTMVEWQLAPRLRQVKGVIEVVGFGGALKQYRVTLDPQRLAAHSVSVTDVRNALAHDNRVGGGGYVEAAGEQIVLRGDARFRGLEDIEATVIRTDERGVPIRVGQLGEVDTGAGLRQGAMSRDGRGEIVGASVYMLKGENSRDVVARVKGKLDEIRPFLPEGVTIEPYYDRAEFIDRVLKTITKNLSEGAIIVVVCLLLTLGSIRAGLLVAGAIPFAMLVGFMGLLAVGYSGNVMSLGAIDFGIVVEGAVLAIEHAMTHGGNIAERARRQRAITHAIGEVAKPAVFSVVITILTFLPLITLEDVEGKMFRPVVVSLCFMLAGALIYALVLVPAVAPRFLTGKAGAGEPWLIRKARAGYVPALAFALRKPAVAIGAVFSGAAVLFAIGSSIGAEFLPRIFEGAFAIDTLRPPSVSLSQAVALSKQTELALKEAPEVSTVVSRIGRPESAVDPQGPEASDTFVILKPKEEWRKGMTPELLMEDLAKRVDAATPATLSAFSQPIEMRVNDLVAGVKSDIAIKVFGEDMAQMISIAEKIRREVEQVAGAADVKVEVAMGLPSMQVRVNREKVGRLGVAPGDVLDVLAMARAGLPVGQVREGERVFDLVLRLGGDKVMDDGDLRRLPIATGEGNLVPLELAADVTREDTAVQVSREQMRRRLTVLANVRGRDLVGFVKEAQARTAGIEVPKSMEVVWGGQFQNFNRAKDRLAMLIPVALGVIALMLVFQFQNTKYMAVTVLNLPLSVAGGLIALVIRGLPFSIPAGVGFIALCGVSVMTGIVMTTALLELQRTEDPPRKREAPKPSEYGAIDERVKDQVRRACLSAFRAPVSTALVAAIGFIPAATATGTGAEVQRPLATVVIGGLLLGMVMSMFALPAMLYLVARHEARHARLREEDETVPEALGGHHHGHEAHPAE